MKKIAVYLVLAVLVILPLTTVNEAKAQYSAVRTIVFPFLGTASYYDDFGNARSGGRTHEGNDLFAPKMRPLVAAVDGTIISVNYPQATWGYAVTIRDSEGFTYHYLHMNNDNPGTDDGRGDGMNAYAPEIKTGNKVVAGQIIGYNGDSGNAETTPPHLHFEIRQPDRTPVSPFKSLQNAVKITTPTPAPKQDSEILPYENFEGGANIAAGNLDSNSDIEYVSGAGPSGGPLIKVYKKNGTQLASFYAYDASFTGGVDVAVADVDDDGKNEIITAPGQGGGPHIKIFKPNGVLVSEFFAYDLNFRGGVSIAAADIDGDDKAEIVTGPGAGGGPHVKVFNGKGVVIKELFAYDANFYGGVDVAAFKATSTSTRTTTGWGGFATAPGKGGGPHIKLFDIDGNIRNQFFAYDGDFNLGVRISAGNARSDTGTELGVIPATSGGPHMKIFSMAGLELYSNFTAFESWWRGGYDIALFEGGSILTSFGGRRASIRQATSGSTTTRTDDRRSRYQSDSN